MKKKVILNVDSENKTVKLFAKGKTTFSKIADNINADDIPLNGIGFVDEINGTELLIGYKNKDPFGAILEVGSV